MVKLGKRGATPMFVRLMRLDRRAARSQHAAHLPAWRRRMIAVGKSCAVIATALAVTGTLAQAKRAKRPPPIIKVPTQPHVAICHPNICFLTQKDHDQYACDHACQWDAPLDADNDTVIDFELKFLERSDIENDVPYMYLDSTGNVTIGIGHLVASKKAAELLPFYNAKTGKRATKTEIDAAFDAIQAAPEGLYASKYKKFTNLVMRQSDIEAIALTQLNEFTSDLKQMFPDYENYPAKARAALLDMMFNLGPHKLLYEFPHFDGAVRAYAWNIAAVQSHRKGIQAARNNAVKTWLQEAAAWETKALAAQAACRNWSPPPYSPGWPIEPPSYPRLPIVSPVSSASAQVPRGFGALSRTRVII